MVSNYCVEIYNQDGSFALTARYFREICASEQKGQSLATRKRKNYCGGYLYILHYPYLNLKIY